MNYLVPAAAAGLAYYRKNRGSFKRGAAQMGAAYKGAKRARKMMDRVKGSSAATTFTNTNTHTREMVNLNDLNASLYTRKRKSKGARKASYNKGKKKRKFQKKVKSALLADQRLSVHVDNYTNAVQAPTTLTSQYTKQVVWPTALEKSLMVGFGANVTTTQGIPYVVSKNGQIGLVDGGAAVGVDYGKTFYLPFKETLKLSMYTSNAEYTSTNPLITDIYECVAAKDFTDDDTAYNTPAKAWNQCLTDGQAIGGATVLTASDAKGTTPFNCPSFGKYWTINDITRVSLVADTVTHFKMHTRGVYKDKDMTGFWGKKGLTKALMFVSEPTFQRTLPAASYSIYALGIGRTINYKVPPKYNSGGASFCTRQDVGV